MDEAGTDEGALEVGTSEDPPVGSGVPLVSVTLVIGTSVPDVVGSNVGTREVIGGRPDVSLGGSEDVGPVGG